MIRSTTSGDIFEFTGLSSDTKPTNSSTSSEHIGGGSTFFEIDTSEVYMFNEAANTWVKLA